MKCVHCGNEQREGQFCLRCGTRLQVAGYPITEQGAMQIENVPGEVFVERVDTSVQFDQLKERLKEYGHYFLRHVKHPSISFNGQSHDLTHAVVSLMLYALLFSLTVFMAIKDVLQDSFIVLDEVGATMQEIPSHFLVFWHIFLFVFVSFVIVLFALQVGAKLFGPDYSMQKITLIYSAHALPGIAITLAALAFILMNSGFYGSLLLIAGIVVVMLLIPLYVAAVLLSKRPKGVDSFYGFCLFALVLGGSFTILFKLIGDSAVMSYLESLRFLL
ncbi:hypothetical protein QWT69_03045 [Sporosarcina oncorhynchi]|uniref:Zinc ribbon domain-containing protein n=1 Tax=Sporosarcina oncorhynchi TaxID=3056444 RepID=A0ABZ0L6C0_9BACL|nr:hypothetical protein [Sporosarcina sp. T2O-4]WOV88116.1 hypothetical protein QWT69_03045 [Sporosarcina sp. T2O-4]